MSESGHAPSFWFPVKRHGWGWGLPVRWQGWAVLVAYLALTFGGVRYFQPRREVAELLMYLAVLTALLLAVIVVKGERPLAWRWGKK